MSSFAALKGKPVIAHDSAEQLGSVQSVVVEPEEARVVALLIGGKKSGSEFVSWDDISALGDDAVMVTTSTARPAQDELEQRVAAGIALGPGKRVLDEIGDELGTVDDFELDAETGVLQSVRVDDVDVAAERLLGIGNFAVVVRSEATP